ncbi:MAG: hypothetical protein N3E48_03740 [Candidatus Bathyarchaeota archaeon]|nr:hypothetical protein [Candidatus Bathyarchaeota archaeon]
MEVTPLIKDNLRRIAKLYVGYHLRTKIVDLYLKFFSEAKNLEELDKLIKDFYSKAGGEVEEALAERLVKVHEEFKTLLGEVGNWIHKK